MKAAILEKPKKIIVEDIPIPRYSDDEVLIKIKEVGLCGSDLHYYNTGRIGDFIVKKPIILGHESSGIVEEAGKNVEGLKKGDRVTIEPGIPCGICNYCKTGNYHLCKDVKFMATPPYDGAFCEYVKYNPNFVYKIPENVNFTEAALVEPLSVGYSAAVNAEIKPGDKTLILGAGPIGISILEMLKVFGASKIFIADINKFRLNIADQHRADKTINIENTDILKDLENESFNSVIEASGNDISIFNSIKLTEPGGKLVWVGMGKDIINIPYSEIIGKDLNIKGIFRYQNTYLPIIRLLEKKLIKIEDIVTHRLKIDNIEEAFDIANNPNINKMKIIIEV